MKEVRTADGSETDRAKIKVMDFFVSRGFCNADCIRLVVVPRSVGTARIFVVAAPLSWDNLNEILTKTGVSSKNPLIPTVWVKASQTGSQNATEAHPI